MKLCYDCVHVINTDQNVCPYCGADTLSNGVPKEAYHLAPGTLLKNYRYMIGRALGYGGFGITYAAFDTLLEKRVAIKEFLPGELATRLPGTVKVSVFETEATETQYIKGLQSFSDEAERLAQFNSIDEIVSVFDCFFENGTAYLVMELLDGRTLKDYLEEKGRLSFREAADIMVPILDALGKVHGSGIIHRDISPDNIFLTDDGRVKLLDFGASRYASAISEKSLSIILKHGYAPEEQYMTRSDQGPWTDVYGAAATMYRMITGVVPDDALERAVNDTLKPPSRMGVRLPKNAETAILNALNVNAGSRTRSAAEFADQLRSTAAVKRYADVKGRKPWALPKWVYWVLAGVLSAGAVFAALLLTGVIRFGRAGIDSITSGNVTVPNLVGMTEEQARREQPQWTLRTVGSDATGELEVGCIMVQDPAFGVSVPPGTPIEIIVNRGVNVEAGTMPFLRGESVDAAKRALSGFNISIRYEYDPSVISGRVKGSMPAAGESVEEGADVELIVSRGGLLEDVRIDYAGHTIELDVTRGRVSVPWSLVPANIEDGKCTVEFSSSNPSVADFADGILTPRSAGKTEIAVTVTMRDEDTGSLITVTESRSVSITRAEAAPTISPDSPDAVAVFENPSFERVLREAKGLTGEIRNRDVWAITSLEISGKHIGDISDAAKFKNLRTLTLNGAGITELGPIGELTELEALFLENNSISDLTPLSGLKKLRALSLDRNSVSDIGPLSGLAELENLDLERNSVSDITPLAGLRKLNFLALTQNQVGDVSPIAGLVNLKKLYLSSNGITDVSPLAGLTELEELSLMNNRGLRDISPLYGLSKLKNLMLNDTSVDDRQLMEIRMTIPGCTVSR